MKRDRDQEFSPEKELRFKSLKENFEKKIHELATTPIVSCDEHGKIATILLGGAEEALQESFAELHDHDSSKLLEMFLLEYTEMIDSMLSRHDIFLDRMEIYRENMGPTMKSPEAITGKREETITQLKGMIDKLNEDLSTYVEEVLIENIDKMKL